MGINLEVYLEQHHSNSDGDQKVERTRLSGVIGKGEYALGIGGRLFVKGYEIRSGNSINQVTLGFREDHQHIVKLDAWGIGRVLLPPDQYLVVQDKTVLEK